MRFFSVLSSWKARCRGRRGRPPRRPRRYQPRLETLEERWLPGDTLFGALLAFDLGAQLSQADGLWGPIADLPSPQRIWSAPVAIASLVGFDTGHGNGQPYAPVSTAQAHPDQVGRNPPALVGAGNWFALVLPAQGSVGQQPPGPDGSPGPSPRREGSFTTIDFPGARATQALGINPRGDIVGQYEDGQGVTHAFLLGGGQFTSFDFPGATRTTAFGISPRGDIVGLYRSSGTTSCEGVVPGCVCHGYLLSGGEFRPIDFPGATQTHANGINPRGDIVGQYTDAGGLQHGFLLSGGEFTTIDLPGATFSSAGGITPRGDIVGNGGVTPLGGVRHGYLLSGGEITSFDFPGATLTLGNAINPRGDIVGAQVTAGVRHAYLLSGGEFTSFDFPGATLTTANGINARSNIVGRYINADGMEHGYLLSR